MSLNLSGISKGMIQKVGVVIALKPKLTFSGVLRLGRRDEQQMAQPLP